MPIITFWSNGKEQTGKTMSLVGIATNMAIEHNKKILIVSTSYNNRTLQNCYWNENNSIRKQLLKNKKDMVGLENGIEGLVKILRSNKINPSLITDYTKIVFKDRLEILLGIKGEKKFYDDIKDAYTEVIELANRYYDYVFVDLDNDLGDVQVNKILEISDIIIENVSQRITSIEKLEQKRGENPILCKENSIILINKYDRKSKYTIKNISRHLDIKKDIYEIPYNTLFFEAAEEAEVPDLFLRLRRLSDNTDKNAIFISLVKQVTEKIIYKIQELQLKRR